jgi:ABC-type transport system involved in multi-copper enzyme maturation permease subunit
MRRAILAEFEKLRRRSILVGAGAVLPLLAIVATVAVFAAAGTKPAGGPREVYGPSLAQLGDSGGLTRGFTATASVVGLLVLIVFAILAAGEWNQGTIRALLTREPNRLRVFGGKAVALLTATAAALLLALVVSVVTAYVMALARGVSTSSWLTGAGLRQAGGDYLRAAASSGGYGLLGLALGTLIRSTTVVVPVAFAWFFPLEHIAQNAWSGAGRWFPGLLLDAVATDGTTEVSFARAVALSVVVVVAALAVASVDLRRRDIRS